MWYFFIFFMEVCADLSYAGVYHARAANAVVYHFDLLNALEIFY